MDFKRKGSLYIPKHEGIRRYSPSDLEYYKRYREHFKPKPLSPRCAIAIRVGPTESTAMTDHANVTLNGCVTGDVIVALVYFRDDSNTVSTTTVTVGGESNMTLRTKFWSAQPSGTVLQGAYLPVTSDANKAIQWNLDTTLSGGGAFYAICLSGAHATPFDADNTASNSGSANPSLSLTTVAGNAAIFAICVDGGADPTAGSGFTLVVMGNNHWNNGGEYKLDAGAAGAKTVDMTAASGGWGLYAMSIKPAGGASPLTQTASDDANNLAEANDLNLGYLLNVVGNS